MECIVNVWCKDLKISNSDTKSRNGLIEYSWKEHDNIDWTSTKIIHNQNNWIKRKFKGAYSTVSKKIMSESVQVRKAWNARIIKENVLLQRNIIINSMQI